MELTGFKKLFAPQIRNWLKCVVADAVGFEPVSAAKFPANREKNREFRQFRPQSAILVFSQRANSIAYSKIPCKMEQGIFSAEQGINFKEQAISVSDG